MIFLRSAMLAALILLCHPAFAAPLQVSPISVDLTAPSQTATVNLRNEGDRPVNVQVRVFSWTQVNGEDQLAPSRNVIASPPAATLQPGTTYTIRLARIAPPLTSGEESYRLLIDQLPEVNIRRPAASVSMALRYSLPVFFTERAAGADLQWTIRRSGKTLIAEATNTGNRHAKIAGLAVASKAGKVSFGEGLNGYVLPGTTRRWIAAAGAQPIQPGASVTVTAKGDDYAVNQTVVVKP
ncbi:fimbrial biogenesis chaperone [Phyllobacterium myrsinacearum]|uniref:Molecular chaperone n=1 Tax=Phyllobacterium myrsinacearum TaxID=28101 RepID=A0A2S9JE54_9HYPH|nr:molecular chaperone [Phyllobacterium myrsinacearum]PRD51175.1 molecular chaperone [Phyllobacterium myrsinacearum]PWV86616.1 fimbrial chaperone protein [Phyllobacterium myrsinacearum]RZU97390.1 fimbrial chaperone protein [Phyllobacterium myrsinacearum]